MTDTEASIARHLESYRSAVLAKDVDAFMRLYDPRVRVFDAWATWSYEGAQAWRAAVAGWFASLGAETVEVTFEDVQVSEGDGFAAVSAIVTYAAMSARGEELRQMQNRLSWVLRTTPHAPAIVHEHTSAPIGLDEAKAILRRGRA